MRRVIALLMFFIVFRAINFCQTSTEVFPGKLNIQPFMANALEPRVGCMFQLNNNELRLDIGNSLDIIHFNDDRSSWSIGGDFFTYTLLRGEKEFHFPVDAIDYLFGFNAGYKYKGQNNNESGFRFRLSHISAHFVDGHYDFKNQIWRDNENPRVYSREFLEIFPFLRFNDLRLYAGFTYIFHIDPKSIGKTNYQAGFDYSYSLAAYVHPFAAYDLKLIDVGKVTANNTVNVGLKFGNKNSRGFSVYYSYYSGKSIHGEYFDFVKKYSAIAFNLDL